PIAGRQQRPCAARPRRQHLLGRDADHRSRRRADGRGQRAGRGRRGERLVRAGLDRPAGQRADRRVRQHPGAEAGGALPHHHPGGGRGAGLHRGQHDRGRAVAAAGVRRRRGRPHGGTLGRARAGRGRRAGRGLVAPAPTWARVASVRAVVQRSEPMPSLAWSGPARRPMAFHARDAMLRAMKLLLKWLLHAAALLAVAGLYSGVQVKSFGAALVAAFVIGLLNTIVRPVLVVLTLPVTLVTLGLFLFVINALMFWAASGLLAGFQVTGFGAALIGSLIYSLLGVLIDSALQRLFLQKYLHVTQP